MRCKRNLSNTKGSSIKLNEKLISIGLLILSLILILYRVIYGRGPIHYLLWSKEERIIFSTSTQADIILTTILSAYIFGFIRIRRRSNINANVTQISDDVSVNVSKVKNGIYNGSMKVLSGQMGIKVRIILKKNDINLICKCKEFEKIHPHSYINILIKPVRNKVCHYLVFPKFWMNLEEYFKNGLERNNIPWLSEPIKQPKRIERNIRFKNHIIPKTYKCARHFVDGKLVQQLLNILDAVHYMHKYGVTHDYIHPCNIVINNHFEKEFKITYMYANDISDHSSIPFNIHGNTNVQLNDAGNNANNNNNNTPFKPEFKDTYQCSIELKSECKYMDEPTKNINIDKPDNEMNDIYALGCLFYYILTKGEQHPYGNDINEQKKNIKENKTKYLRKLLDLKCFEAHDLIFYMINNNKHRLTRNKRELYCNMYHCKSHPFFWSSTKKLDFIAEVSNCLSNKSKSMGYINRYVKQYQNKLLMHSDLNNKDKSWKCIIDYKIIDYLASTKEKKYNTKQLKDYLRLIRNKFIHFDFPKELIKLIQNNSNPNICVEQYYQYFTLHTKNILMFFYYVLGRSIIVHQNDGNLAVFKKYYINIDSIPDFNDISKIKYNINLLTKNQINK